MRTVILCCATALMLANGTSAPAQLSGLLGALLPNVASVGAGNAAGVLGYCLRNRLLGSATGASSVLGQLTGKTGTTAPGYAEGKKGLLQTEGMNFPLDSLKNQAKTKVCDLVLKHAQNLL